MIGMTAVRTEVHSHASLAAMANAIERAAIPLPDRGSALAILFAAASNCLSAEERADEELV